MVNKTNKKLVEDPDILLQKIKSQFPELKCESCRYVGEGWDHEVLILDEKYVFRFPNDDEYREKLLKEVKILNHIAPKVEANIPKYKFVADDGSFAGYPIVPGDPLGIEAFDDLSKDERDSLTVQMAEFLTALHTLLEKDDDMPVIPESWMSEHFQNARKNAQEYLPGVLSAEDFKKVEKIISEMEQVLSRPRPNVFTHGDIYHKHILWDADNKKLGIIDFSDVTIGDPAVDFAELYEYGRGFAVDVYKEYRGPKDEEFMQRAWVYEKWVSVFLMANHFEYQKHPFDEIRKLFDTLKDKTDPIY